MESSNYPVQTVSILGSTGSIGVSTLDVIRRHPDRFKIFALTADRNSDLLAEQCAAHQPEFAVIRDKNLAKQLRLALKQKSCTTKVLAGEDALVDVAEASQVDTVMAAIVGAAGLLPTLAAAKAGKKVLLANKEAVVMAGDLFMAAIRENGAQLLPIDSEHNAIFQCLPSGYTAGGDIAGVKKVILTGSGGPFLNAKTEEIANATPEQACKHPKWSMGRKISVDSATLMNKGLEFIEACYLFSLHPDDIEVVIHPQSIVHSMVEYSDGSVLAQLGNPNMRIPIAHALGWPERISSGVDRLDLIMQQDLQFQAPDMVRFPALPLSMAAAAQGKGAATVLNAANEVGVDAFLKGRLNFGKISHLLSEVMTQADYWEPNSIDAVLELDFYARKLAQSYYQSKLSL
ncbi:MAG: 1-deoxy-D-xylulose-5-phosphate reductoisomerase [Cellvibrionaceae bacterium]|jgi:1-deoxy-D-xylulose-5-phosphate reductoisomerase